MAAAKSISLFFASLFFACMLQLGPSHRPTNVPSLWVGGIAHSNGRG
jgi:hypothetical protein